MPLLAHRKQKPLKGGWIPYQEGGLGFKSDPVKLSKLLGDGYKDFETKKVGITFYVRGLPLKQG